ncbi:TPA: DUF1120 domain-containing protein [Pseudomonas putida]|nr:DUF1120 domain-containing protein [Pseudomonas putida]
MNKTLNTLFGTMLLAGSASAFAASSVDLTVTGLITPSACTPTLANGGVVDYGKISAKDLNVDQSTIIAKQNVQLNVTCDAATLMALETKDNREGSNPYPSVRTFGLGLINGNEKLGRMALYFDDAIADGTQVRPIISRDGGTSWTGMVTLQKDGITSVAELNTVVPLPFQVLTANIQVAPEIAPTKDLTLTNEVSIDGSVTLTVRYL